MGLRIYESVLKATEGACLDLQAGDAWLEEVRQDVGLEGGRGASNMSGVMVRPEDDLANRGEMLLRLGDWDAELGLRLGDWDAEVCRLPESLEWRRAAANTSPVLWRVWLL